MPQHSNKIQIPIFFSFRPWSKIVFSVKPATGGLKIAGQQAWPTFPSTSGQSGCTEVNLLIYSCKTSLSFFFFFARSVPLTIVGNTDHYTLTVGNYPGCQHTIAPWGIPPSTLNALMRESNHYFFIQPNG